MHVNLLWLRRSEGGERQLWPWLWSTCPSCWWLVKVQPSPFALGQVSFALPWADVDSTLFEAEYGEWVEGTVLGVWQPVVQPVSCSSSATQSPSLYLERIVTPQGRRPGMCKYCSVPKHAVPSASLASHGCSAGKVRQSWAWWANTGGRKHFPSFHLRYLRVTPWLNVPIRQGDFSMTSRLYWAIQIFIMFSKQFFSTEVLSL